MPQKTRNTRALASRLRRQLVHITTILSLFFGLTICAQGKSPAPKNTFLMVSDIHFNPMADASLVDALTAAAPAQWETIFNRSKATAFSQYGEDTNWWLLHSSLDAMRTTLPHPAFILIAGDLLAHQFPQTFLKTTHDNDRENYRKFVLKTMQFLALQFQRRFPDTQILFTPGNNDENCGNYSIRADGVFLHDTTSLVSKLAHGDDDFRSSWQAVGSYDIAHPTLRGVRIISLNSVFFSAKYHPEKFAENCATTPSTGPSDLFAWLESRLSAAQEAHEKVWLMFHIPPGMDSYTSLFQYQTQLKTKPASEQLCMSSLVPLWLPSWTAQFDDLLAKYHSTVIAGIAGHTHQDSFAVINVAGGNSVFVLINPAVSPVYNQNPSFRVITFANDGSLLDQSTYYLTNLDLASKTTLGEWKREYTFSEEWKLLRIDAASLSSLYTRIVNDETTRDQWLKLLNVSSAAVHIAANGMPGTYCAIEALSPEEYGKCYCGAPGSHAAASPH